MNVVWVIPANDTCGSNGAAEKPPQKPYKIQGEAHAIGGMGRAEPGTFSSHLL